MLKLDPQDRRELNELLSNIPQLEIEEGRRQILELAGLGEFVPKINLAGATAIVVGTIVTYLEKYGRFENGETALGRFLLYIKTADLVGSTQKEVLDRILNKYELVDNIQPVADKKVPPTKNDFLEKQIFISYAWGGESEEIAERVDKAFQERGITIVRDKRDAGYKANILEFMERIGKGKCVITIISEKYLKSSNCMFELVEIAKNGDFYDRIFPIVLEDAKIYKPISRLNYIKYWEDQIKELEAALKEVSAANLPSFRKDIDLYTEIRKTIDSLIDTLKQMNTLTPEMHSSSDFEELYKAIEDKLNSDSSELSSSPK